MGQIFLFYDNIYKAGGNRGKFLTLSHPEAWFWMGQSLESHSECVTVGRSGFYAR